MKRPGFQDGLTGRSRPISFETCCPAERGMRDAAKAVLLYR